MRTWNKQEAWEYIAARIDHTDYGCWEWQGPVTRQGYGQVGPTSLYVAFGIKGVHRLVVHLETGFEFTSRDQQVMHGCDNRRRCNPEHLSIGTAAENMRDAWEPGGVRRGEDSPSAKLCAADVREIKLALKDRYRGLGAVLSRKYNVSKRTIFAIGQGILWRHIVI